MSQSKDQPLKSIIETPLTDSLINELFHQQNADGSFPADEQFDRLFGIHFNTVQQQLKDKGLNPSMADEIHRLILTASVLFYFLYHSQKATFPVDIHAIETLVAKARAELEGFSLKDDPIMQTYVDKGELAVKFVTDKRARYASICQDLKLSQPTWELYIQHLMNLDKQS